MEQQQQIFKIMSFISLLILKQSKSGKKQLIYGKIALHFTVFCHFHMQAKKWKYLRSAAKIELVGHDNKTIFVLGLSILQMKNELIETISMWSWDYSNTEFEIEYIKITMNWA